MLQPTRTFLLLLTFFIIVDSLTDAEHINISPRRGDNGADVTTVLLVDNHGRPSYGRFLNVKPDVGLITSTARTFVQEGVTTEYATQVVGTTLDDGRLYAHLLSKTSRVISDGAGGHHEMNTKFDIDKNQISRNYFVGNTDFISPNQVDAHLVFPTSSPKNYGTIDKIKSDGSPKESEEQVDEELLKGSPSNNIRVPSDEKRKQKLVFPQNNIKVFKIKSNAKDERENVIYHKEEDNTSNFQPSKVKEWDNIPTFTIRNEFSPSGFSYLGDLPEFDDDNQAKKQNSPYDRRAKNLFKAGLLKPSPKQLKTTTYKGFADFTTTVGDTVIVFTPHTSEIIKQKPVTKITVEPTIRPTVSFILPPPEMKTEIPLLEVVTELTTEKLTTTEETTEEEAKQYLQSKVIDKVDRQKYGKSQNIDQIQDMDAKASVLAHEQQGDIITSSTEFSSISNTQVIESSESQTPLLSTPSHEDIAKIFASLQAQANKATEPLNSPSTIFFDTETFVTKADTQASGGATTIFFEDDLPIDNTPTQPPDYGSTAEVDITTNLATESNSEITTQSQPESVVNNLPTPEKQSQYSEDDLTTTEGESILTTLPSEETTTEDVSEELTTTEAMNKNVLDENCSEGLKVIPTTIYKTLTYLTTFFIPVDETTTTSINAEEVVTSHIELETKSCSFNQISPTNIITKNFEQTLLPTTSKDSSISSEATEQTTTEDIQTTEQQLATTEQEVPATTKALETTPQEITTERKHVTESEPTTTEETTDDGEEIELIFKTLYTTYTYLTTYFQDTTSSIASRIVVTTNVITSTLDPGSQSSEDAVAGLFDEDSDLVSSYKSKPASFEDFAEISPSQLDSKFLSTDIEESGGLESSFTKTPHLSEDDVAATSIAVKTYYTTYTYFTTIFVDGETEVSSRTEVYTNYVTPSIKPTSVHEGMSVTKAVFDENDEEENGEDAGEDNEDEIETEDSSHKKPKFEITPSNKYNKTISRNPATSSYDITENATEELQDITTTTNDGYVTLRRTTTDDAPIEDNLLNPNDYESISTMVRSSTSNGERRLLNNVDKRNILDDQIVSESNNDSEIIPSPTLLLQTSYTTFTYFTTMYQGNTGSNVVSRLETVTNIVTETLTPSHTLSVEDLSLPITYFTTFTYWTTLYKQGTTKVTSREETVSNVITPTAVVTNQETSSIEITATSSTDLASSALPTSLLPSTIDSDYSTTVYTTYTYYTTSYVGDETVINSRLETVTSILNKTNDIDVDQTTTPSASTESVGEENNKVDNETTSVLDILPTGIVSTVVSTVENSGTTTVLSTDVIGTYINGQYAQILESTSSILTKNITPNIVENLKPTGVVSINEGKIIDADEISTLYYTTQAIGTYINNVYAQVIQSTSSLKVDEEKKASLGTEQPIVKRTGLVRLVQGSMVQNKTTTLYQSRVIGTVIDGRYAQIIESTSSFIVDKHSIVVSPTSGITPTSTVAPSHEIKPTIASIAPSSAVIEGSILESAKEEDVTKEIEVTNTKTKPSYQSKKKTFKPGIRPFVQRPKSSYSPKRRLPGATSATTVTRNDFTPTVTAIPASKGRFGNRRNSAFIQPTSSGSRRFSRPKSTSSFGGRRGSSRIQPTSTGFGASSRRGFRSSSGSFAKSSGLFSNSARFRIRPTTSASFIKPSITAAVTESSENEDESNLTTLVTDEPDESENDTTLITTTTTETSRRQNPLLRFRRPPLGRPPIVGRSTTPRSRSNSANRNTNKATTTTPKPRSTRAGILSRNRPNALFPRRNLFTTSTTQAPPEEEEEAEEGELDGDDETLIEENEEEDTDYEGSQKEPQTVKAPTSSNVGLVKIKPFNFRRRTRRDTYSRFRRPTSKTTAAPLDDDYDDETPKPKPKYNNRFSPRSRSPKVYQSVTQSPTTTPRKRITPNKVKAPSRTQFTLRPEKEKPNFRRPSSSRSRTATTQRSRSRSSYGNHQTETSNYRKSPGRSNSRNTGSRRVSSRQKIPSQDIDDNYILPAFDGTITVTHQIPTEVTIPVINGKITEYKNIVTARLSTEILEPAQYSTSVNPFGKEVKVLVNELTTVANNGATYITQFILNETPTTSVVFTPTYIRNRKTSYSHIVPSTIYAVEQVVNTIQPALAAQAPLANILLSQLLLGGLQTQNPLLALQNPGVPPTPTTEFKTRTTTYVTTVTSTTSTIIPLTFRGKEILTTIVDSSVNIITATEFLTDTVVVTPTAAFPVAAPQLNTLLLPLLQQQLAQSPTLQLPQNISPQIPSLRPASPDSLEEEHLEELDTLNLAVDDVDKPVIVQTKRRSSKGNKKPKKPTRVEPTKETSVITLYVSGKTPGEFSTVLSTIISDAKERRRRDSGEEIKPSKLVEDLVISNLDYLDSYILPGRKEITNYYSGVDSETESLESILGDVNNHIKSTAKNTLSFNPTKMNEFTKKFKIKNIKASSHQNEMHNFLA